MLEDKDIALEDICARLSLRPPQKESLVRLAAAVEAAGLKKGVEEAALDGQLAAVRALYPHEQYPEVDLPPAAEFDWEFLSFAFALATGVGKTRLMGAIIAYLYRVKGLRNFVVIAPGTTIYEKLIADFTEGSPKYVFKGLACFATKKPIIVTGNTYQSGVGILDDSDLVGQSIVINVFNIQKLNERVEAKNNHDEELAEVARIRRLNERIGQSYFDYLKSREDLVVLMDEAHHYRASAAAATINELQPVLGIEMTATPRVGNRRFNDVLCDYDLAKAMNDGFVKEPAVVRRQHFRSDDYVGRQDELDRQKLTDAIIVHEANKTALAEYAFKNGIDKVKPFVLVVAPDTTYAREIEQYLKSSAFYGGKYADKVIAVDYKSRGNNDEAIAQLLDIERPGNKIEIVIHVNMLSEGWDVTNLYTIVPLRAANSPNLVEQTIGRGLRLPYGKRTGVPEIDTLSIVSHDKFDKIIEAARNMRITIREREVPASPKVAITVAPIVVAPGAQASPAVVVDGGQQDAPAGVPGGGSTSSEGDGVVVTQAAVTTAALNAIGDIVANDMSSQGVDLSSADVQGKIAGSVAQQMAANGAWANVDANVVSAGVAEALRLIEDSMIEIPRITITPGTTRMHINAFPLDFEKIQVVFRDDRLVYDYVTDRRVRDVKGQTRTEDLSPEDINRFVCELVSEVAGFNDIDYDDCGELVGSLCEQCINGLAAKLPPDEMMNCMRNNRKSIAEAIRRQLIEHAVYDSDEDIVDVRSGNVILKANTLTIDQHEEPRQFDMPLADGEKSKIRNMIFKGFKKCLFSLQKFDSDPEREFSVMLEREDSVKKWFKPTLSNLRLYYGPNEYTPDFVVETETEKLLCEVKAVGKVDDAIVQAKKEAALKWCHYANESTEGAKKWRYLLVPDVAINGSLTLSGAISDYGF